MTISTPPRRPNPRTWPALIAWIGMCTWHEWLRIVSFVVCIAIVIALIAFTHLAGWL